MGISKYDSQVSLPCAEHPYPSILTYLARRFPHIEAAVWQQRIVQGKVLDETGAAITIDTPYRPQKRLFYFRESEAEAFVPLQEKVLFQNDELLVACKPPFLPVTPSGPYINDCLLNRLRATSGNDDLVPLHRIDRETAGLVLFSTNRATRGRYGELFSRGMIEKTYEALSEVLRCPETRSWSVENRLVRDAIWFRNKTAPGLVNARSRIRLLSCRANRAHFQLVPLTGKKHQLRIHMSGLGFSIMHDRYYPELRPRQEDDYQKPLQLIAKRVRFVDPVSGRTMEFESERRLLV